MSDPSKSDDQLDQFLAEWHPSPLTDKASHETAATSHARSRPSQWPLVLGLVLGLAIMAVAAYFLLPLILGSGIPAPSR